MRRRMSLSIGSDSSAARWTYGFRRKQYCADASTCEGRGSVSCSRLHSRRALCDPGSPLDHKRHKRQRRPVDGSSDLPAALRWEDDPARLEAGRAVSRRNARLKSWSRSVETPPGDPEPSVHRSPPAELHADPPATIDEAVTDDDQAVRPEPANPELPVAVRTPPAEERLPCRA